MKYQLINTNNAKFENVIGVEFKAFSIMTGQKARFCACPGQVLGKNYFFFNTSPVKSVSIKGHKLLLETKNSFYEFLVS